MDYKSTNKISEKVIEEILDVKEKRGLTAENIVDRAKSARNPLHELFEWDNDEAGEKWRLQQARVLINEVKVIVEGKEYYAFENVTVAVSEGVEPTRAYFERQEIMSSEELKRQVIESAFGELLYWKAKYEQYSGEFGGVLAEIRHLETQRKKIKAVA